MRGVILELIKFRMISIPVITARKENTAEEILLFLLLIILRAFFLIDLFKTSPQTKKSGDFSPDHRIHLSVGADNIRPFLLGFFITGG